MTMTHAPISRKPTEGRKVGIVGDLYRFLATGEETDGKYATANRRATSQLIS